MAQTATVAIVDDDPSVRNATNGLLKSRGYSTVSFAAAEDFLNWDRIGDVACVITDVKMPGMSGVELQSRLIARGLRTPVIFMTAFPEETVKARVLSAGAFGFLTKPFRQEHLIDCLELALQA